MTRSRWVRVLVSGGRSRPPPGSCAKDLIARSMSAALSIGLGTSSSVSAAAAVFAVGLVLQQAGSIAARPRQVGDEARPDRVGDGDEHNRHGAGLPLQRGGDRCPLGKDYIRVERDQFFGEYGKLI